MQSFYFFMFLVIFLWILHQFIFKPVSLLWRWYWQKFTKYCGEISRLWKIIFSDANVALCAIILLKRFFLKNQWKVFKKQTLIITRIFIINFDGITTKLNAVHIRFIKSHEIYISTLSVISIKFILTHYNRCIMRMIN